MSWLGIYALNDTLYFSVNTVDKQGSALAATSGPTYAIYSDLNETRLATGTMSTRDAGYTTGFYAASISLTSTTFSAGQYFIHLRAQVDSEWPETHLSFQIVAADQSVQETFDEIHGISNALPSSGFGAVLVDHDYGGTDNYRILSNNRPLARVTIRVYVKTDYDAGRKANRYTVGEALTGTDGRWLSGIRLDAGTYTMTFSKPGAFKTRAVTLTVT